MIRLNKISESSSVHHTVIIEGDVEVGPRVIIGPFCHIIGPVKIEEDSTIASYCFIKGPVEIGKRNRINPRCIIGTEPESRGEKPTGEIRIGDDNILTELTTITHGTKTKGTNIGNRNYFLRNVHISHDCELGNDITIAHNVVFGGNVLVQDGATIGISSVVHQGSIIGAYSMIGMNSTVTKDILPFSLVSGTPVRFMRWNSHQLQNLGMGATPSGNLFEQFSLQFNSRSKREILHIPDDVVLSK